MDERELVLRTLEHVGLAAEPNQADALLALAEELAFWGPRLGLSTLGDKNLVITRHVLDSLLLAAVVREPQSLLDIGTGAGLPAVPLAMVWPQCRVIAMDGKRKSHWLVSRLAMQFGLENLQHACMRADSREALEAFVGRIDLVTCRGLAQIERALSLCRPHRAPTGLVAVLGGPDLDDRRLRRHEELRILEIPGTDWRRRILLERGSEEGF